MFYSVVIPVYNEKDSLTPLYDELKKVMDGLGGPYETIFINDASIDGTHNILEDIGSREEKVRVVSFIKKKGQALAFHEGFNRAQGDIIITMDGDLQDDPKDIPRLLGKMQEGYDVVCGWRKNRKDRLLTRLLSKIANLCRRVILHEKIHDVNCSLRAYKARTLKEIKFPGNMYYMLTALLAAAGYRVAEIEVNHRLREFGKSNFNFGKRILLFNPLLILRFIYNKNRYINAQAGQGFL